MLKVKTKNIQGRRTKSAKVETNDPKKRRINLKVSFLSQAPVEVYPQQMAQLSAFAGEMAQATLVFHRPDGEALVLEDLVSTRDGVKIEAEKVSEETADPAGKARGASAGDWRVKLTVEDSARIRNESGSLKLKTNHPLRPELKLPLRIRIRPVVEFQPNRVQLRATTGAAPVHRTVSVRNGKRKAFDLKELIFSGDLPGVTAAIVTKGPSSIQQVRVSVDPKELKAGVYRGTLTAKTSLAGFEEVSVPVRITAVDPRKSK